jgi:hypothetical protein
MAFPDFATVVEDFAGSGAISGNWTTYIGTTPPGFVRISGIGTSNNPAAAGAMYYSALLMSGATKECYLTWSATGGGNLRVGLHIATDITTARNGYDLLVTATEVQIREQTAGGSANLGSAIAHARVDGDVYGISYDGTNVRAYVNAALIGTEPDGTYASQDMYGGAFVSSDGEWIDSFAVGSGGAAVAGPALHVVTSGMRW